MKTTESTVKQSQSLLRLVYGLVPIVAGLDKFTNLLTDWSQYLGPGLTSALPFSADVFFMIIGVVEIAAGLLVLFKTQLGAYVVAAWLVLVALSLLISGYYDVAVRDLVMAAGAYTLARLSQVSAVAEVSSKKHRVATASI